VSLTIINFKTSLIQLTLTTAASSKFHHNRKQLQPQFVHRLHLKTGYLENIKRGTCSNPCRTLRKFMVQIKEKKRNKYTSKSTVPVHFESSSPDDIWKNEKATKGPRTGGKGGCLPKATRGSTFSSFLTADSLELFSLSCL
jgi:hypothetical protein